MSQPAYTCPCAPRTGNVFALLGKRWNGQIIDLLLQGPARFGQLVAALPGLSHRVLTERLTELREAGLVIRTEDNHYALTPRGEGLRPAIDALATWSGNGTAVDPTDGSCFAEHDRGVWEAFSQAGERLQDALERRVRNGAGMPASYFELLIQLRHTEDRTLRMSKLAAATRSKPSRITHAVNQLERAGWVTRDAHPTDGRGSTATLTDEGIEAMDAARPEYTRTLRKHLLSPLTPTEQHLLRVLCEKVLASFEDTDD